MFNRRDKFDIIANMLEAVKSGRNKKTQIMYKAKLSFKQINEEYLPLLEKKAELIKVDENNGGFQLTDKGNEFLKIYRGMKSLITYS
jgi:predicted transcriptional regulator